jgi:DNA-binding CsgD family transcriptional regulator
MKHNDQTRLDLAHCHGGGRGNGSVLCDAAWDAVTNGLGLSPRELQVLRLVVDGHTEDDMAERLALSPHTIHTYMNRLHEKLQSSDRARLIARILREYVAWAHSMGPPSCCPRRRRLA